MTLFRSGQQNRTLWVWAIETTHLWSAAEVHFRARSDLSRILGEPDCSVVINNALAIERRGGRDGGGVPMLARPVGRDQRPWNKGLLIGQKNLSNRSTSGSFVRLEIARSWRDLVIVSLAIDSKLRASDLVKLRFDDICSVAKMRHRATIVQKKAGRPVQFEITEQSRSSSCPSKFILCFLYRSNEAGRFQ
jgi:hypothetical protein